MTSPVGYEHGRLTARPGIAGNVTPLAPGEHVAPEGSGWQGNLFVPPTYRPLRPAPLLLAFHGATGSGERMLGRWRDAAAEAGLVLLAPDAETRTWDVLIEGYGADVARIDRALAWTFGRLQVDRNRLLIGGFSDGASYALGLGIANGDLFTHIIANSPGFCWPPCRVGRPRILITHGDEDPVLPIAMTSHILAPQIAAAGYEVTFEEFHGGHKLTPEIMALSLRWTGLLP